MTRIAAYGASLALVVAAFLLVPMPLTAFAPGGATPVTELVSLGTETTPLDGETLLLTVRTLQPSMAQTVDAWLDPDQEVQTRGPVPQGVDRRAYFRAERVRFERTFDVAIAVGARAAGVDVELGTAPFVAAALQGAPARGQLRAGDLILAVGGVPVATAQDMIDELGALQEGESVRFRVRRDGDEVDVDVTAGFVPQLDRVGLGVLVETIASELELPFDITLEDTNIGGPSGGLMTALTVYDLLSDENLLDGRRVAGTGEITAEGAVGPISAIAEKVATAERADADVFLAPLDQLEAAQAAADEGLQVIGVGTLDDAIEGLRDG